MRNNIPEDIANDFEKTINFISNINFYLKNYKDEIIELFQKDQNIKQQIQQFNLSYSKYEELERFSIPIIGKISSGKSTILNYILDLKGVLQVQSKTTTKFICIIRHNRSLKDKNPLIYSVNFVPRADLDNHYNFVKNELIKGDIKKIIEKRNHDLMEKKIEDLPQNYFYIIENYIPLFEGKYEKYADFFEFLDVPGLNEISDNLNNDNIYFEKVLPFIINNIKFSIFIFETKFYTNTQSISLYKKFIDKLNNKNKDYFDEKVSLVNPQVNSIYILNKIDLCDKKGGIKQEEKDFKKFIEKDLKVNVRLNKRILLNSKEYILNKDKYKDFNSYLDYICNLQNESEEIIPIIIQNLKNDFNIDVQTNIEDDNEDDVNNEILCYDISKSDYKYYEKFFDENKEKKKQSSKEEISKLKSIILSSIEKTYDDFKKIEKFELLEKKIKENFMKNQLEINNNMLNIPRISFQEFIENKNYLSILDKLGVICKKLNDIEPNHEYIKKIYSNFLNVKNYIQHDYKYRISLLGGISTGKSSIINTLIGYDLDLIPKSSDHCTNIALIIHYTENKDNISLYETKFDNHNKYSNFYYFSKEKKISNGKENVKELLKKLNEKEINEIPYYILETPIEFLDEIIQDNNRKLEIEFVDLPGINIQKFENSFLSNLIKFTDFFLFINDKDVIQDENKEIIEDFFKNVLLEKTYFNLNSIMFVVNQIDLIPEIKNKKKNINDIIKEFSKEINLLINKIISYEWNNYLKFCEICKDEKILFSYFSNEIYNKNKKQKKQMNELFNNFIELIKYIIQRYRLENHKPEEKIKGILKYLKMDYFNKLENKNEYNDKAILDIKLDLKKICDELKISDGVKKMYYSKLEEIIKKYNFIKMNLDKIEYNFNFNDFLINIKNKISEKDVTPINSVIFKFISELYIDFKRIKENLHRIEANEEIQIIKSLKLKTIYEKCKKTLEAKFQEKVNNLKNIEKQIINTKDNVKFYYQFLDKFNELSSFMSKTIKKYSKDISKCHREEIKKYSLKTINIRIIRYTF